MLSAEEVKKFNVDGYLKGHKIMSDDEVETLREETMRVIRDREDKSKPQPIMLHNMGKNGTEVWQIVNIWRASPAFKKLVMNKTIAEEMVQLTGAKTLRIWHDQIQYKPAGVGGANMWHQDAPYWPPLAPMTQVTAWVALDDVDPENGCMSMVPGSHLWGNQIKFIHTLKGWDDMPGEFEGRKIEVRTCPVRKGEVHYHHALTWHGSPANNSQRPRRAIALHFMSEQTRFLKDSADHPMKKYIEVGDGEVVQGAEFPVVYGG